MRGEFVRFSKMALLPALILLLVSCTPQEQQLDEHMARADEYYEEEEFAEAIIEYKSALQIDPNHASAHYGLAKAFLRSGQPREGFWELRETVRLDPSNLEAKIEFAQLAIIAREKEEALKQADEVIAADPSMVTAHLMRGQALESLERVDEAQVAYEQGLEIDPESDSALHMLAAFHARRKNLNEAEPLLVKLIEVKPNYTTYSLMARFLNRGWWQPRRYEEAEVYYHKALEIAEADERRRAITGLANFLYRRDRFDESVEVLKDGIETEEEPLPLIYQLARLHLSEGNEAEADALMEQATKASPDDPEPFLILSAYRGRKGDLEAALTSADQAVQIDPDNEAAKLRKAEVLVEIGYRDRDQTKVAEGRVIIDEVLADQPSNPGALFVSAKIDLAERKVDDAIKSLRAAIDSKPDWAQAHYVLGTALAVKGEGIAARNSLARALEIDAGLLDAKKVLAQVHARLGEHEYAVETARRYLRERPGDVQTRILLAQSLVRLGKPDEALVELNSISADDRSVEVYYALGRIDLGLGNYETAREHFLAANELMPGNHDILRNLLNLDRRENRLAESVARIEAAVQASPEKGKLYQLRGIVALVDGRSEDAEKAFQKAVELDPSDIEGYDKLAGYYFQTGRVGELVETYEQALEARPDDARIHYTLGVAYDISQEKERAIKRYEDALRRDPSLAEAMNNLAFLYADRGENMDRALDLAQEAKTLLPENASVADTLGWVLYLRGVPSAAISYLKEAEAGTDSGDRNIGLVRHHLALAYEANGDTEEARETLGRALAGLDAQQQAAGASPQSEPRWAKDARAMLERLDTPEQG